MVRRNGYFSHQKAGDAWADNRIIDAPGTPMGAGVGDMDSGQICQRSIWQIESKPCVMRLENFHSFGSGIYLKVLAPPQVKQGERNI